MKIVWKIFVIVGCNIVKLCYIVSLMQATLTQIFCIGTFFRWAVSPEEASEMQCFVSNICENWNIFVSAAPHRTYPYFDVVVGPEEGLLW